MASIQVVRPRRKGKVLSRSERLSREEFESMELDGRVEAIRSLVGIGLMQVRDELDREVVALAGERYARKDSSVAYRRHGSNPGSVKLAGQRHSMDVPRVRGPEGEVRLSSYDLLHADTGGELDEGLFRRVLLGISCRDYEAASEAVPGAIGLSSSTVSRRFKEASRKRLRELMDRDLSDLDLVSLFVDGKSFASEEMILAVGVTIGGEKVILGFCQTATENARAIGQFFGELKGRGLSVSSGVLVVIDGSKGLRRAVKDAFGRYALVQRCQWHKRENVVSYLPKKDQPSWRRRLQWAYQRPTYKEAKRELEKLIAELDRANQSAASSLREGLEETLTLHRLGVFASLGLSFKTTNCIESINSMCEQRCRKINSWKNSNQKQRWFAAALLDIEPRLRRVRGYRDLPRLRAALMRELALEAKEVEKVA